MIVLVLLFCVLFAMLFPKKRELKESPWQAPLEPPGVTIVTREPQALTPKSVESDVAIPKPVEVSVVSTATTTAALTSSEVASASVNDRNQIRNAIARWSAAWSARDMDTYLGQYANEFVPAGGQSRQAWEKSRRQRIQSKRQIFHEVRDLDIQLNGEEATAHFEQSYAADKTRVVGPKTLRLKRYGVNWLIISESAN